MSGHSKWHNIQAKKGKADAARGAIFTRMLAMPGENDDVQNVCHNADLPEEEDED